MSGDVRLLSVMDGSLFNSGKKIILITYAYRKVGKKCIDNIRPPTVGLTEEAPSL